MKMDSEDESCDVESGTELAGCEGVKEAPVPGALLTDLWNVGIVVHFFAKGFCTNGTNALVTGVFSGYLNVPTNVTNTTLNLASLPQVFTALVGALSDHKPIWGFHRRPYMVIGWSMNFLGMLLATCVGLPEPYYCYTEDGSYLLHQAPCNPHAKHQYVPVMLCILICSTGLMIAGAAGDGFMVELAKAEPEEHRGRCQAAMMMVYAAGNFCAALLAAFGFNGRMYTGSFDQRDQMDFTQYCSIFMIPSAFTIIGSLFFVREQQSRRGSMRAFWSKSWELMKGSSFALIAAFTFMNHGIFQIRTNATNWVSLQWAEVKMMQNELAALLGIVLTGLGTWIMQRYLLQVSWRKIIVVCVLATMAVDAVPQFLTIFDIVRDQYFYLGEPIVTTIPTAMTSLVAMFVANEVADENNCASVIGILNSINSIATPFSVLVGNQIFSFFSPSLTERENYIEDAPSFRWTVAASYLLTYAFALLLLAALPMLPWQKAEAQRRKREWPSSWVYPVVALPVLLGAFLYALTGDILIMDEELSCLRFLGGTGC